jgi:hypothetical protein
MPIKTTDGRLKRNRAKKAMKAKSTASRAAAHKTMTKRKAPAARKKAKAKR